MSKQKSDLPEIRIQNVKPKLHEDLQNISKNLGVSVQHYLKPKLQDIVDAASPHLKEPFKED